MARTARGPADGHVLVVGAGGIGCPAALALAGLVGRVTLVDPDRVEPSNLPRQVLYTPADVGRPKALVAAQRLGGAARGVTGVHARLDRESATALLRGVDVLVDATDGARTKDWLNQLAVRRAVPLVHAAGLRAEGRLLVVPAGGRPCLACLFGRLEAETGSCADLGVWNGVVGAVGFLAAHAAYRILRQRTWRGPGYAVLDFETGRALALGAAADDDCPVCARAGDVEPYPQGVGCALPPREGPPDEAPATPAPATLDLRQERCPLNLLRARRALAALAPGALLDIELGEEGAETVPQGVVALGHAVVARASRPAGLFLRVRAGRAVPASGETAPEEVRLDEARLDRFARQVVLPEVGEAGQRRLLGARVLLAGQGPAVPVAGLYLAAAGVGRLGLLVPPGAAGAPASWARLQAHASGRVEAVPPGATDGFDLVAWAGGSAPPPALASRPVVALTGRPAGPDVAATWDVAARVRVGGWFSGLLRGALLADAAQRRVVQPEAPLRPPSLVGLLR